ncbi:MAG: FtsW/RodA/SpoVE family cell cycle protein [Bacteroidaceae bacterium]|nr:FtsW/RodA/SpoVE family cell cycle protein [Bacteroidaceae bacterium]
MGNKISSFLSNNFFKGDKCVWMIYFFLCMISLVEIYSASSNLTFKSGNHWSPMISQAGFLVTGFIIILVVHRIPCKYFKLLPLVMLPLSLVLLVCTRVVGGDINNSQRWLSFGFISFQPSEIAKTALILSIAMILSKTQCEVKLNTKKGSRIVPRAVKGGRTRPFWWCVMMIVPICGLICTENFSTACLLFVVVVVLMFIGHIPYDLMFKGLGVVFAIAAIGVTTLLSLSDSQLQSVTFLKRATTWKSRIEDKFGINQEAKGDTPTLADIQRQETNARISISNSDIIGRGAGNSEGRDFLYRAESDFIYAIIVEELGVLGGGFLLGLYLTLLIRTGRIAQRCDKFFPSFVVMGLGMMITLQALVNMGVAVGMLPVTGQTLPLISKGGSSILMVSFNIGMILSISRYADKVQETRNKPAETVSSNETEEYFSSVGME